MAQRDNVKRCDFCSAPLSGYGKSRQIIVDGSYFCRDCAAAFFGGSHPPEHLPPELSNGGGTGKFSIFFDGIRIGSGMEHAETESAANENNVKAKRTGTNKPALINVPAPREIKAFLDQYVVGQDETKRTIAVAVHNHYRRVNERIRPSAKMPDDLRDVEIEKSNILLAGPTGSGKTLIARTLARMLDVPFAIADATTLTEAGYVGEDVENILLSLIQNAGMDIEKAQRGIIFVDEIDKIGRRTENVSITRDVSGEGVQQSLLKILEGTVARVPPAGGRKHPEQRYIEIETKDILFICGGAFIGLDDIMRRRADKSRFGFLPADKDASGSLSGDKIEPEDLIGYGLIPEFVGRLPVICRLKELSENDLTRVLTEPKNCLVKQYRKLLAMDGVDLKFEDSAIKAIAREAVKRKTGARGLRAIVEELMVDIMYGISDRSNKNKPLIMTEETVISRFSSTCNKSKTPDKPQTIQKSGKL